MIRILTLASILGLICLSATAAMAPSGFDGKWATDRLDPEMPGVGTIRKHSIQSEFTIEGDKVTGTIAMDGLGGTFFVISEGKLVGKQIKFRTVMDAKRQSTTAWTGELVDDNTLRLSSYPEVNLPLPRLRTSATTAAQATATNQWLLHRSK